MFYGNDGRFEDLGVAYQDGYDAYMLEQHGDENGRITVASNPYTGVNDDDRFNAWQEGYQQAAWDN